MTINNIIINCKGNIECESCYYRACDTINQEFSFSSGTNIIRGDIDSGGFGISYLISMYDKISKKTLLTQSTAIVNGTEISLLELNRHSCYIDRLYNLFSRRASVESLVIKGLKKTSSTYSCEDIRAIFKLDQYRFKQPLIRNGNEIYRAMCAIGFSFGKSIFCFPWFSARRYNYFKNHITFLLELLSEHNKVILLPIGN